MIMRSFPDNSISQFICYSLDYAMFHLHTAKLYDIVTEFNYPLTIHIRHHCDLSEMFRVHAHYAHCHELLISNCIYHNSYDPVSLRTINGSLDSLAFSQHYNIITRCFYNLVKRVLSLIRNLWVPVQDVCYTET